MAGSFPDTDTNRFIIMYGRRDDQRHRQLEQGRQNVVLEVKEIETFAHQFFSHYLNENWI